jgi:cell division FtsZ-interacting protein ZapD
MGTATATSLKQLRAMRAELHTDLAKQALIVESLDRPGVDPARLERASEQMEAMHIELTDLDRVIAKAVAA